MRATSRTLLTRVRDSDDSSAWDEFHELYAPLLYRYARGRGLTHADAQEVRDRCLATLTQRMREFEYDRSKGSFKSFLYRIVRDTMADLQRSRRVERLDTSVGESMQDGEPTPDEVFERTWLREHLLICLEEVRPSVSQLAWQAFHMLLFDEASVPDVAAALGINANQVYKAKSRILAQIRERMRLRGVEE